MCLIPEKTPALSGKKLVLTQVSKNHLEETWQFDITHISSLEIPLKLSKDFSMNV